MIVVSIKEGPKYNGSNKGCLTPGKEYEVLGMSDPAISESRRQPPPLYNPIRAEFVLYVIDDNGHHHAIWNDYFYPTEKEFLRNMKIDQILI
jgi:hypothetical protein